MDVAIPEVTFVNATELLKRAIKKLQEEMAVTGKRSATRVVLCGHKDASE